MTDFVFERTSLQYAQRHDPELRVIVQYGSISALAASRSTRYLCRHVPGSAGKRFSLRTLLIATTLVAVVLGLIVWAAK